jgi:Zn-finger nucleic acid-binding protein
MRSDQRENEVGVELKYCEHCGGLWVRERGAGAYCLNCQPKVAELPKSTKKRRSPALPVRSRTTVEDYEFGIEESTDFEAAGGLA